MAHEADSIAIGMVAYRLDHGWQVEASQLPNIPGPHPRVAVAEYCIYTKVSRSLGILLYLTLGFEPTSVVPQPNIKSLSAEIKSKRVLVIDAECTR